MRLTHLQLRDFRCFEFLEVDLAQTTVLIGANDTGKSTVLEALHWLLAGGPAPAGAARETGAGRSRVAAGYSVVGHVTDMTPHELERFGPTAVGGALRLGRASPEAPDIHVVIGEDDVPALLAVLDEGQCLALFETTEPAELESALFAQRILLRIGDQVWVNPAIWELSQELSMPGLELLEISPFISTVRLGGRTDTAWSPGGVVEPIIARRIMRASHSVGDLEVQLSHALRAVKEATGRLIEAISSVHTESLARTSDYWMIEWTSDLDASDLADMVMRKLSFTVRRGSGPAEEEVPGASLGPGARRSVAISALDLYRDPHLWLLEDEDSLGIGAHVILLLEEPEAGLDPAAQRRLARSLRGWATYGLQLVVVTHSPTFVNAADLDGVRLARRSAGSSSAGNPVVTVVRPTDLQEIRDSLGVQPADILLARRFVVVEGESDRVVLGAWARQMGLDLRSAGVQLVSAGGYGMADQVARFLGLAFEGAEFMVVLDSGMDTADKQREIDLRFGGLVKTHLLSRTEIEGFYRVESIVAWLLQQGATGDGLEAEVREGLDGAKTRASTLNGLAERHLGRRYQKVMDGRIIANLTSERHLDPEIQGLLRLIGE